MPVPPPVSVPTLLNAIRLAAGSGGGSSSVAFADITGQPTDNAALAAALAAKLSLTGGTMTGALAIAAGALNTAAFSGSQTWNNAGVTCRGIEHAVTDTNSAADSTVMRLRGGAMGTTDLVTVDKSGNVSLGSSAGFLNLGGYSGAALWQRQDVGMVMFHGQGNTSVGIGAAGYIPGLVLGASAPITFCPGIPAGGGDLLLSRNAAASLQLGGTHATTPTAQTIGAHPVTTGTGAALTLQGGAGSVARGQVNLKGASVNFEDQTAVVDAAVASTHSVTLKVGGTSYKFLLATP